MSHYTQLKPKFLVKNESDLRAALEEYFKKITVHNKAVNLGGYDTRANKKAHLVIDREHVGKAKKGYAYNDVGFERMEDGTYTVHYDEMDVGKKTFDKVSQNYFERVATRNLKSNGYTLKRTVEKNGEIKIVATNYS